MPIFDDPPEIIHPEQFYMQSAARGEPSDAMIDIWSHYSNSRSLRRRRRHLPARYQRAILVVILVVALWATMIADILNRDLVH